MTKIRLDDASQSIVQLLPAIFEGNRHILFPALKQILSDQLDPGGLALLRQALFQPSMSLLWYQRLLALWKQLGRPPLKPNPIRKRVAILTNFTVEPLLPLIEAQAAAFGIELELYTGHYDSVEQAAYNPSAELYGWGADTALLLFSEHWLTKQFGSGPLVSDANLNRTKAHLLEICHGFLGNGIPHVLVGNFPPPCFPSIAGAVRYQDIWGLTTAIEHLNAHLADNQNARLAVLDIAAAVHLAGGSKALSTADYLRAKWPYSPQGAVAVAREIASALAAHGGKNHRAVVCDFDNTLWGGEIGELGADCINCGLDDPDGLGYYHIQQTIKGWRQIGVAVAGASRNDPKVAAVFDDNPCMPLRRNDFATLQIGWGRKSDSIATIAEDLGFGPEFMLFMDDSVFELAETLLAHPYLDVLLARPQPDQTLTYLAALRPFNAIRLSEADMNRGHMLESLHKGRELLQRSNDYEAYLRALKIRIDVTVLNRANAGRVAQMFQKTNQFNLTTRRHDLDQLREMTEKGGAIFVFSYTDVYGPQGIIAVASALPQENAVLLESWLMSCRVLNRRVEFAIFAWLRKQFNGKTLMGEFIPSERNVLVADLYKKLGFELDEQETALGGQMWRLGAETAGAGESYFAEIVDQSESEAT